MKLKINVEWIRLIHEARSKKQPDKYEEEIINTHETMKLSETIGFICAVFGILTLAFDLMIGTFFIGAWVINYDKSANCVRRIYEIDLNRRLKK